MLLPSAQEPSANKSDDDAAGGAGGDAKDANGNSDGASGVAGRVTHWGGDAKDANGNSDHATERSASRDTDRPPGECGQPRGETGILEQVLQRLLTAITAHDGLAPLLAGLVESRGDERAISEADTPPAADPSPHAESRGDERAISEGGGHPTSGRNDDAKRYELHVVPLGSQGVVQELLKFRAPGHWEALFVAAEGYEICSEKSNVRVALAAARDGRSIALLALEGKTKPICGTRELRGRIIDCMLRALDLPTSSPTESVALVSRRHRTWEELRQAAIAGEFLVPEVSPDLAEWMDAGIFSRWCLESFAAGNPH